MVKSINHQTVEMDLATLAAGAAVAIALNIDGAREHGIQIEKFRGIVDYENKPATLGPLLFGLCENNLTTAEIAEALTADPQDEDDIPASEQSIRKVYPMGIIPKGGIEDGPDSSVKYYRNIAYPWKRIQEGEGIKFWVQNLDGSALTGNTFVTFTYTMAARWLDD